MPYSFTYSASDSAQRLELEHNWEFLADPAGTLTFRDLPNATGWRSARVGLSWNVQFEDLRDYLGAAWYRTRFTIPRFPDMRHILLKFGAVDYFCEVYLNGVHIGKHEGGYTPFSFEITAAVRMGANDLVVHVIDPPMDEELNRCQFPDMMYNEIPHGKQNWYVQNGGIWQGVRVEFCPSIFVDRVDVTPEMGGKFHAAVRLSGMGLLGGSEVADSALLRLAVFDSSSMKVFETTHRIDGEHCVMIAGQVADPKVWGPGTPMLYTVVAAIEGSVQYRRLTRFGFRSFEARDGKLFLNGEPFYMVSALDQDFYPETIHSPGSAELVRDMMLKAQKAGINVLRCHLKVAHPVYLDTADELGMLVWAELPSWSDCWFPSDHFSYKAAARGQQMFDEILMRDWNHPSIVVQTIMNESWGINLKDADQRAWLRAAFDRMKANLAPLGRLVVDNSACENNFHLKTDIEDFHQYYSMPDQRAEWDKWLDEFAGRPAWTFSPYGDAERTGREPLLVSEFGNWGLPELPRELPWWFHRNFGDREATRPSGVLTRFDDFGFGRVFGNYNDFAQESQRHQFASLKYEIESIRRKASIQGYVITGMTDVHWEANGLLDMWRTPKLFIEDLRRLQEQDVVLCVFPDLNHLGGNKVRAEVLVSHYSSRNLRGARVRWTSESGAHGNCEITSEVPRGTVARLCEIDLPLPEVNAPRVERVVVEVRLANGTRIIENSYELFCFPQYSPPEVAVRVHDPDGKLERLRDGLRQHGCTDEPLDSSNAVVVSSRLDDGVASHLNAGGHAIVLVDDVDALPKEVGIFPFKRAGTEFDGRWFSNFNWIRSDIEPFEALAFSRILGFESEKVVPRYILRGVTPEQFSAVLCGTTYGWLNLNSALAINVAWGPGAALLTTFRFDEYGADPYATHLLDGFMRAVRRAPRTECRNAAVPANQTEPLESQPAGSS